MRRFQIPNFRFQIIAVLIIVMLSSGNLVAAGGDYGTESIFAAGTGSRALSMGNAFTALSDDSSAVYFNPAGLVSVPRQEAALLHYPLYEGTLYNSAAYANTILGLGTIGAALYRVSTGGIKVYDADDVAGSEISFEQYKLSFSFGRKVSEMVSLGGNLNFYNMSLSSVSAFGFGFDAGIMYEPFEFLRAGFMMHNIINPSLAMREEKEDLPRMYTLGALFKFNMEPVDFNITADVFKGEETNFKIRAGFESVIMDTVSLRAGYNDTGVSFGAGIKAFDAGFDYAFIMNDYLGGLSRFTLSYRFGLTLSEQEEERKKDLKNKVKEIVEEEVRKKSRIKAKELAAESRRLFKKGRYEEALVEAEKALEWAGDFEEAKKVRRDIETKLISKYYDSALAGYKKGNFISALEGFRNVIKIDRKYKDASERIKSIEKKTKMDTGARKHFNEGVEYYVNKQYDKAVESLTRALKTDPSNTMIKTYIAKAKAGMVKSSGRGGLTPKQAEKVKNLYYSGLKKYTAGDIKGAVEDWKKVLKMNPEDIKTLKSIEKAQAELAELKKRGIK